jgi:hypothetical protein
MSNNPPNTPSLALAKNYECERFLSWLVEAFGVRNPLFAFLANWVATSLRDLEGQMCKAEAGHAVIFLLVLVGVGYCLVRGWPDAAAWLALFSVPINGYPIMLQRYNRIKLEGAIRALEVTSIARA